MDCFYLLSLGVRSIPFHLRPLNWSECFFVCVAWVGGNIYKEWRGTFLDVCQKKREIGFFFLSLNAPLLQKDLLERLKSSSSPNVMLVFMQHLCSIWSFSQNQIWLMELRLWHHCTVDFVLIFLMVLLNPLLFFPVPRTLIWRGFHLTCCIFIFLPCNGKYPGFIFHVSLRIFSWSLGQVQGEERKLMNSEILACLYIDLS